MGVVGFNYDKIMAERKKPIRGKVDINSNVFISKVEETKLGFAEASKGLNVSFTYNTKYEPDVAVIEIEGIVVYVEEGKKIDELMKKWKKEKKLPRENMTEIINYVLAKCNIEAIILSRDINIPSPVPMPKVSGEAAEEEKPKKKK